MVVGCQSFNEQSQKEICYFDEEEIKNKIIESNQYKLLKFKRKLNECGHTIIKEYRCKQCEDEGHTETLLAFSKGRHDCKIRFCSKPNCVCQRFAEVLESLESIKRFENLRTLHHFSIGFSKVSKYDYENNFDKIKKKHERVMNIFMKKCRDVGVNIEAYRCLDTSKGKQIEGEEWDEQYYIHYHFAAIPFKRSLSSIMLTKLHKIRKEMLKRQRKKIPFHFQSYGLVEKKSILCYISLRSIGLYKKYEPKKEIYEIWTPKKLRQSLKDHDFILLNELINEEQYLQFFFQHRHLAKIGDLPTLRYGSNRGDNITFVYCKRHGKLAAHDRELVSVTAEIDPDPPPDNISVGRHEFYIVNASKIEIINKETNEIKRIGYKTNRKNDNKNKKPRPFRFKVEDIKVGYYNITTAEEFKGTMQDIRRNEFKKQIERENSIIPKQLFKRNIWQKPKINSNYYPLQELPPLEGLNINITELQRASEIVDARCKKNNNKYLTLNNLIDLQFY